MRIISILVFLIGVGIAGTVAYMVTQRMAQQQAAVEALKGRIVQNVELVDVIVANRDLRYGVRLQPKDVKKVAWPKNNLPPNVYLSDEDLFGKADDEEEPRTVIRAMDQGEILSSRKLTDFGADAGVASKLERGMRAFALRVNVSSGVSGFLRPGDKIDVYWTGTIRGETVSKLILDGIQLIAIDQIADADRSRPIVARTITVSVSPQRVASLAQAQATGQLQMSLRGIEDDASSGEIEVNQRDLLGIEEEVVQEVVKEKVCTIRTRVGGEIKETVIPCRE